ncbi:MAG: hypothetical protein GY719_35730 [bacterium]|nr:hypothetical protein [bacterium]
MNDRPHRDPLGPAARRGWRAAARIVCLGLLSSWLLGIGGSAWAQKAEGDKAPETTSAKAGYKVIVNADNPAEEMEAAAVAKMFRKKLKRWQNDVAVAPVDLGPRSEVRKSFTKGVHGKSIFAIKSYWQRMIFSGRDEPPQEKATESEVLSHVRANAGGIGYVSSDASLGTGVKELKITQ